MNSRHARHVASMFNYVSLIIGIVGELVLTFSRLAKAAMAEVMAPDHNPSKGFSSAYGEWADGGWGMVITGKT